MEQQRISPLGAFAALLFAACAGAPEQPPPRAADKPSPGTPKYEASLPADCRSASLIAIAAANRKSLADAVELKLKEHCGGGEQITPEQLSPTFVHEHRAASSEPFRPVQMRSGWRIDGLQSGKAYEARDEKQQSAVFYTYDRPISCEPVEETPPVFGRCGDGRVVVGRARPTTARKVTCPSPYSREPRESHPPCLPASILELHRLPVDKIEQVIDAGEIHPDQVEVEWVPKEADEKPGSR